MFGVMKGRLEILFKVQSFRLETNTPIFLLLTCFWSCSMSLVMVSLFTSAHLDVSAGALVRC